MRKSLQRLALSRETLCRLEDRTLPRAAAGLPPESFVYSNCVTCDSQLSNCPQSRCTACN
jgi:hypothetical protein